MELTKRLFDGDSFKFNENSFLETNMNRINYTSLPIKILIVLLYLGLMSAAAFAQTDVEIEVAGPWSYVHDSDPNRIQIVAPNGHNLRLFTGDSVFGYTASGITDTLSGTHRLDFVVSPCGASSPSAFFLYPINGLSEADIQADISKATTTISLPKPCSFDSQIESVFKYHGTRPVIAGDPERSFTTVMTLHYKVKPGTTEAVVDNSAAKTIGFGTNTRSSKKAISIVLYMRGNADTSCDSHSALTFDDVLSLWNAPHPYRAFPKLKYTLGGSSNQQISGSYAPGCAQSANGASTPADSKTGHPKKSEDYHEMAPGRADCHAAQVNINGVVN